MILISSWSCLCPTLWSQVLSREWRCSWSSTDRRCSLYQRLDDNSSLGKVVACCLLVTKPVPEEDICHQFFRSTKQWFFFPQNSNILFNWQFNQTHFKMFFSKFCCLPWDPWVKMLSKFPYFFKLIVVCILCVIFMREDNDSNIGYDYTAYMDYMNLAVCCPRMAVKLNHLLTYLNFFSGAFVFRLM